jgi:hypothetical protein
VSSGRLQVVAAAVAAVSALAAPKAGAVDPVGLSWSALEMQSASLHRGWIVLPYADEPGPHAASAGATMLSPGGWRASLFVTHFAPSLGPADDTLRLKPTSSVNARLSHPVAKDTRFTLEVFNVFDRRSPGTDFLTLARPWSAPGMNESYLTDPGEPRGFRIRIGRTF